MDSLRRHLTTVLAMAGLGLGASGQGSVAAETADEMSLGDPRAKVTVVEYASVACPFCARFNNDVFPAFKAKYIDSGKVRYVFREMLVGGRGEAALGAAGFMMARCLGRDKYFAVLDETFHAQESIYKSGNLRDGLLKIAQANGMSEAQFTDCISNVDGLNAMNARHQKAMASGVNSTPTFLVNGKKVAEGVMTLDQLDAAIRSAGV